MVRLVIVWFEYVWGDLMSIDIATTSFLSAEEICSKLSVSRSTFDRWRKITTSDSPFGIGGFQTRVLADLRSPDDVENEFVGLTPFPEPTMYVGGSPRWAANVVNKWLVENKDKRNKRGIR